MALRIYRIGDRLYQFEEGEQPEGAVPYEKQKPTANKAKKPANKKVAAKTKEQ